MTPEHSPERPEHTPGTTPVNGRQKPPGPRRRAREVADVLRARIGSGQLRAGARMPTQAMLAEEFGTERGTVRQALRILQSEGLLAGVSRGSPATVAPDAGRVPDGPAAEPRPTTVALAPRVSAAFAAPHVEIDALCLTSISLNLALGEPLRRIHAGRVKPAKVDVRVLLPRRDIPLAFPTPVAGADVAEGEVHRRWLAQRNAQSQVLRHNLLALRGTHGIDVHVTFRALPFTPPVKLYLLNGTEALFAYYTVRRREAEIDHEALQMYDAEGTRVVLFPFAQGAGTRDTTFVEQSQLWFDALWETISSDLEPAP
ncbi:GntR family transcriptional regulator [Streptomyces griseoaurantiacus M045]|uniref:GntR family transcriptional regulator n=1 Tax=Streptomyces griseoaurantiacus M045 TaxID=996637 RepID=F3NEF0_9ACTN|nr:GntR family transcriptional regulator [Streptomyces griseoaurantiacus M045]